MFKLIKAEIRNEYLSAKERPWIVGFSGGKDSTLVVQLLIETLLAISPDERRRQIFILYNDTQVDQRQDAGRRRIRVL